MVKTDFFLARENTVEYLAGLRNRLGGVNSTIYLPPGLTAGQIDNELSVILKEHKPPDLTETIRDSKTGSCLFSGEPLVLIIPPFPVVERVAFQGIDVSTLSSMLQSEFSIGIVLIRLGSYALAVCRGQNILTSKVGTGLIHGRHRQGGSSAARFRRHREKQIETFMTRVCGHLQEVFGPYLNSLDYKVLGGAWTTLELLEKQCPVFRQIGGYSLPPMLDIPDPRQYVLESAIKRIWSSQVIEWREDQN